MTATRTSTFLTSEVRRADFRDSLVAAIEQRGLGRVESPVERFEDALERFAQFAESQLGRDFKEDRSESRVRGALQSWLAAQGVTLREAHEGSGQTDLWFSFRDDDTRFVVEVKVPSSAAEFEDGLTEAAQYALSSSQPDAFYVAVDHCPDLASPRFMPKATDCVDRDAVAVHLFRIRVADVSPSRVGRVRRAAGTD
jgi:hypothetical protein